MPRTEEYQPCPLAGKCLEDWCVICSGCGAPEGYYTPGCPECQSCIDADDAEGGGENDERED